MSSKVEFENYSVKVKDALNDACIQYLHEAAAEIRSKTVRNTRTFHKGDGYDVRGSWKEQVDEKDLVAKVGSELEASYWEELGTGTHALNKDGRKGWWVYIKGGSGYKGRTNTYDTQEEAEKMARYIRATHNLEAYATNGMEPNRPLHRAFESRKAWLQRRAAELLGEEMGND